MSEVKQDRSYKIHGIELITISILPQTNQEHAKDSFEFNIKQEQKTNANKKLIIVFTSISIQDSKSETTLANLQVACGFELLSFESIIKRDKEENYIIPHELSAAINRISVSVCRGILYSQLRGSYLQNLTLPLLPIE